MLLLKNISQLVTCSNVNNFPKKGKEQNEINLRLDSNLLVDKGRIEFIGSQKSLAKILKKKKFKVTKEIDCKGKVVTPGFIDSHTHLVFSGNREDEYEMRIAGKTYQEIAAAGGGIASTVSSVRKSSFNNLYKIAEKRLSKFIETGTTTIEVKSGYGLDTENEIKILRVIKELKKNKFGLDIIPTFLGAHAVPKGATKKQYIESICYEMIPKIAKEKLAEFIDVFCEVNYFDKEDTARIFSEGIKFGMIPKIHTDQFNSIGGVRAALKHRAISVDHLEVLKDKDIKKLSGKNTIATLLPGVSYFLDISYQPARKLIANNVPVALATDFNPGSCPTQNMQMIMSLASIQLKMTAEEILNAVTINAAYAVNRQNKSGSIEIGKQADLLIFDIPSYKFITYNFAVNNITNVIKKGRIIK
ncbi:MAG: imidazolonepropionase [Bacteroidetes bacterium]|nr:imidazolonepropionase [Bacteroidota bacterium]